MPLPLPAHDRLSADEQARVRTIVEAATVADGTAPLNERATLDLTETLPGGHVLLDQAYAQVSADGSVQVVVHPDRRGEGTGRTLVAALLDRDPAARFWSFGDLLAARRVAQVTGLVAVRVLLVMSRPLADLPPVPAADGVTLRSHDGSPSDTKALVSTNAAAFAGHPEQGAMDAADLARRLGSPTDVIVAVDDATGRLLGFHWTKQHPEADGSTTGEVYVIGAHPDAHGRGLGRTLLWAGLHHLAEAGADRVVLYVEGDNDKALRLYDNSGFTVAHRDVLYAGAKEASE